MGAIKFHWSLEVYDSMMIHVVSALTKYGTAKKALNNCQNSSCLIGAAGFLSVDALLNNPSNPCQLLNLDFFFVSIPT
jgi:hypothetical protein